MISSFPPGQVLPWMRLMSGGSSRRPARPANIGANWTPRELRHSFVSLMSSSGVPVEEIARLAGHSNTRTTEVVYRRELRPVLTSGAEAMDRLFKNLRPSNKDAQATRRTLITERHQLYDDSRAQLPSVISLMLYSRAT